MRNIYHDGMVSTLIIIDDILILLLDKPLFQSHLNSQIISFHPMIFQFQVTYKAEEESKGPEKR